MTEGSATGRQAAAFFDFDGTLVESTIAHYYRYFVSRRLSPVVRPAWQIWFLLKCVVYLVLDRIDREKLNVVFYRNYRGLDADEIKGMARDCHRDEIARRVFREARDCVSQHQAAGRIIVLVTGSIDFIVAPFVSDFAIDAVIAPGLVESNGRFTGELTGPPIGGAEKARRMRALAEELDLDMAASYAYGDSIADLPMLEAVGHPQFGNPDSALAAIAQSRDWPAHSWSRVTSNVAKQLA